MSLTGPIVCIEDDDDDQHLLKVVIKNLGVQNELLFFDNGETLMKFLSTTDQKPFLILCDINLPLMNGIELRQKLNDNEYLRKKSIPFVFISTAANPQLVKAAYEATVQGYFKKADTYMGLRDQIDSIITYWKGCIHPNSNL